VQPHHPILYASEPGTIGYLRVVMAKSLTDSTTAMPCLQYEDHNLQLADGGYSFPYLRVLLGKSHAG